MLNLSFSAPPLQLRQIGPNTFEVITEEEDEPNNNPSDLGYDGSQPSSSSASIALGSTPLPSSSNSLPESSISESSKEEKKRLKNIENCRKTREKKKKKAEEERRELERLEEKNRDLKAKIKSIKEVVAWLKSSMRDGSRNRKGEGDDSDQEGKRKR